MLPLLRPAQVHLSDLLEENAAEVIEQLVLEADLHEPFLILQNSLQLVFDLLNLSLALNLPVE